MKHLIVFQHGMLCHNSMLNRVVERMKKYFSDNDHECDIVVSDVNNLLKTFDGIATCGKRLAEFVERYIELDKYDKISFIGHSMGGMIIRHCIGILEEKQIFDIIDPNYVITIATPHMGLLKWKKKTFLQRLTIFLAGLIAGKSGQEFLLEDKEKIILQLCDSNSNYVKALEKFKFVLYSNLVGDDVEAPIQTSLIFPFLSFITTKINNEIYEVDGMDELPDPSDKSFESSITNESQITYIYENIKKYITSRRAVEITKMSDTHFIIMGEDGWFFKKYYFNVVDDISQLLCV